MNFIYKILLVAAFAATCSAQETCGHTSTITPRHFFNMSDYVGDWYMHKFSASGMDDLTPTYKCLSVNYSATSNPNNFVTLERYIQNFANGSSVIVEEDSLVVIDNREQQAYWKIYSNQGEIEIDSVILHTDYTSFSVAYTCQKRGENGTITHESVTILTRDRVVDTKLQDFTSTLLLGFGFPPERHWAIDQTGCEQKFNTK